MSGSVSLSIPVSMSVSRSMYLKLATVYYSHGDH